MKRIAIFALLGAPLMGWSQNKDTAALEPVEVRALRAGSIAPFAKTNISKQEIARQNLGQDLPFLLNQTPSVVINADAGNGIGYTGIRIRGTDATRINVTLNGIPYNDAESQGTFFVDLPDFASSVNSIQIQRGVGTSTNGAGAFGATINFSTNEVNKKAYAEINNSFGSFHSWKNTIKAGTGLLDHHFTVDARLSRISSDGYIDRASSNLRAGYISAAYLSDKSDLRLNVFSGKEKTYQAWYGVSQTDLATNRTVNYAGTERAAGPYDNETDNYRQDHYQLFFTHRIKPSLTWQQAVFLTNGKGYYEQYKANQKYSNYYLPNIIKGTDTIRRSDLVRQRWLDNDFYGTTFSLQHQSEKTQFILGGAVTRYDGNHFGKVIWAEKGLGTPSKPWYDLDAYKNDWNMYAKWQEQLTSRLSFFADWQYRRVHYRINGFKDNPELVVDTKYNFFNPKFGLSYQVNNWLIYTSYSIANKEPNREDFEANPNERAKPERLNDWETGVEKKGKNYSFSANVYYMRYRNQLVLTGKINDVGAYTRTNIPRSYRAGIELQGAYQFCAVAKIAANIALSRNRISDFTEYIDDYDNSGQRTNFYRKTDIALSPAVVSGGTLTLTPMKALQIDFIGKYVSSQYLDNTSNKDRMLNAFYTQDVRAIYSFKSGVLKQVDLIAQVNNIFNKKYEPNGYTFSYYTNSQLVTENYYFPMAGTNFMVALNIKL